MLKDDQETKRELGMLRKLDQEENYMRSLNIHNIYKQKLQEKIMEKKERAERIWEQQVRIADMCRTVRVDPFQSSIVAPQTTTNKKTNLNLSSMF